MRVLVYGLGRSGGAVSRLLRRQGHEVVLFDSAPDAAQVAALEALGCSFAADPHGAGAELCPDLCIAAPGVAWDHPDLTRLRAEGIETIGEVEWVYRTVPAPIVGITGTAGKGTVTRWLTDVLENAGVAARAGGNLDPALSDVVETGAETDAEAGLTLVAELSSFMLERCPTLKPEVAILLNLGVDHLDRHGSVAAYHGAKRNLLRNLDGASTLVYNADDPILKGWAAATPARALGYSLTGPAAAHLEGGWLHLRGERLLKAAELRLQGRHNHGNALAVALAAAARGLSPDAIAAGLVKFGGLPGRYSLAGKVGGVSFIEDSIATRGLAVRAALEATPAPIVWLGGGLDKGADFAPLEPLVRERVRLFIGIGAAGPAFAARLEELTRTRVVDAGSGREALRLAAAEALAFCQAEGLETATVLLAPLAASFDQFKDYGERARAFREVVASLVAAEAGTDETGTNETGTDETGTEAEEAPAWT